MVTIGIERVLACQANINNYSQSSTGARWPALSIGIEKLRTRSKCQLEHGKEWINTVRQRRIHFGSRDRRNFAEEFKQLILFVPVWIVFHTSGNICKMTVSSNSCGFPTFCWFMCRTNLSTVAIQYRAKFGALFRSISRSRFSYLQNWSVSVRYFVGIWALGNWSDYLSRCALAILICMSHCLSFVRCANDPICQAMACLYSFVCWTLPWSRMEYYFDLSRMKHGHLRRERYHRHHQCLI